MRGSGRKIVILGGGSGGLELAASLAAGGCDITLIDRVSSHLWKPRLHEFAAGTVNSTLSEISFYMLAQMRGFSFEQGRVEAIDRAAKQVRLAALFAPDGEEMAAARDIPYDTCVVALGGVTPDFGVEGVAEHAIRLDARIDADMFRERFIAMMIGARASGVPAKVVIIGSGATGTELAAHLRLAERAFFKDARKQSLERLLDLTILESAPELMPGVDEELRQGVAKRLKAIDIKVHTNSKIVAVEADRVRSASGETWPSDATVWAAGLVGHPCLKRLADFEMDRNGRIVVDDRLRSSVDKDIYVLGDAASLTPAGSERPLPPTAQVASQEASYLASVLPKASAGEGAAKPFVFNDKGRLISLGRAGSLGLVGLTPKNDFFVDGQFAKAAYHGLQRRHQWSVLGPLRGSVAILADIISPTKGPAMKLHG